MIGYARRGRRRCFSGRGCNSRRLHFLCRNQFDYNCLRLSWTRVSFPPPRISGATDDRRGRTERSPCHPLAMIHCFRSGVALGPAGANDTLNAAHKQHERMRYTLLSNDHGSLFRRLATPPYLTSKRTACRFPSQAFNPFVIDGEQHKTTGSPSSTMAPRRPATGGRGTRLSERGRPNRGFQMPEWRSCCMSFQPRLRVPVYLGAGAAGGAANLIKAFASL
jgi:hypothetical protein